MALSFWNDDLSLQRLLARWLPGDQWKWGEPLLQKAGVLAATTVDKLAAIADHQGPRLHTHDAHGERLDVVEFHPAYRELEKIAYQDLGLVGMIYGNPPAGMAPPPGGRAPRLLAMSASYLFSQSECGLFCPVCMTDGVARVLELHASEQLIDDYVPRIAATDIEKLWTGAMFLTEKQGGSDVGANNCEARAAGSAWELYGDKWFCSNVNADAILALARPDGAPAGTRGLALFLVPKHLPDGTRNHFMIHRIKDKLGVRSMATGEVTFDGTLGYMIGAPGQGFHQMVQMVNLSRLYNSTAAIAIARRSVREATNHARSREAFGRSIDQFPLLRAELGNLTAEAEALRYFVFAGIRTLDNADAGQERESKLIRILTPLAKFYTGAFSVRAASQAMEILGGNGYVEEFVTPRLLRDAQVLPIWEGTSNIQMLDTLRAIQKESAHETFFSALQSHAKDIDHPALAPIAARAMDLAEQLARELEQLTSASDDARQLAMRTWAPRAVHALASTLIVEGAQNEIDQNEDARLACVAQVYAARVLEGDPAKADHLAHEHYEALAYQDGVRVDELAA